MTIKQQGGVFGRNPTFNDVSVENSLTVTGDLNVDSNTFFVESSTNRVGINNNNPTQELEVDGTIRVNLGVNDYAVGVVSSGGGGFFLEPDDYTASNPTWKFRTFANENIGMFRGNSDCGTFTANGLAFPNGKGIDFSATSGTGASELFDDYEEGTWTPAYNTSNDDLTGVNYYRRYGFYTKIGNVVTVQFHISTGNAASAAGTGFVILEGLPFSINITATSGNAFGANVASDRWSADAPAILVTTTNGSTSLYLAQAIHSNYNVVADFNNIASNNYNVVAGHFTYRV